jgi:Uma2 family endonuclease
MQIEIRPQHSRNLQRWRELQADRELARLPHRIETDRFGRIIMSPPPALNHSVRQSKIFQLLTRLLTAGEALAECPLSTSDGIKAIDVAWIAPGRTDLEKDEPCLEDAPEICVEVLSPSNSVEEMSEKRALYFEAGAQEVWLCGLDGEMSFFKPEPSAQSALCSEFPSQI